MLVRPKEHPLQWYPFNLKPTVEVFQAYINTVEEQVVAGIDGFHANEEVVVPDDFDEEGWPRFVKIHKGLDGDNWDLHGIFTDFFPNLQRYSTLITLFSFFEQELDRLCRWFHKSEKLAIAHTDLAGKGVERAKIYLSKAGGIDFGAIGSWSEIMRIQRIRNLIVHADGVLPKEEDKKLKQYIDECTHLSSNKSIILHNGYLAHVLKAFDECFAQVHKAIEERYKIKSTQQA